MGLDDVVVAIISIFVLAISILAFDYTVSPILIWIDIVPFDGAIPLATSWAGWFWITFFATGLVLWAFKALVVDGTEDAVEILTLPIAMIKIPTIILLILIPDSYLPNKFKE